MKKYIAMIMATVLTATPVYADKLDDQIEKVQKEIAVLEKQLEKLQRKKAERDAISEGTPENAEVHSEIDSSAERSLSFTLGEEPGEYGEIVNLNVGTEFEEAEIAFHIPVGTYSVTNQNKDRAVQISIYCGGPEYDGEWQYFVADDNCARPLVLMQGETGELEIKVGQFVVLSDGSENVEFTLKSQ